MPVKTVKDQAATGTEQLSEGDRPSIAVRLRDREKRESESESKDDNTTLPTEPKGNETEK